MEAQVVRPIRLIVALAAVASVLVAMFAAWVAPDAVAVGGYTNTPTGPIGPADRDLLAKVKQAGLWEMPAGADLTERAKDPKVREIGTKINAEHHELDHLTDEAAATLGVILPKESSTEQQHWVQRIAADPTPDAQGVFLLRRAHGIVLPVIASVRVSTRNSVIRDFATTADTFVTRHIGYLESTGLVDYTELPEAPTPLPNPSLVKSAYYAAIDRPTMALAVLAVIAVISLAVRASVRAPRRGPPATPARHSLRRT